MGSCRTMCHVETDFFDLIARFLFILNNWDESSLLIHSPLEDLPAASRFCQQSIKVPKLFVCRVLSIKVLKLFVCRVLHGHVVSWSVYVCALNTKKHMLHRKRVFSLIRNCQTLRKSL